MEKLATSFPIIKEVRMAGHTSCVQCICGNMSIFSLTELHGCFNMQVWTFQLLFLLLISCHYAIGIYTHTNPSQIMP